MMMRMMSKINEKTRLIIAALLIIACIAANYSVHF